MIRLADMYIYDIDTLFRTADQLNVSPIVLALQNLQYDGIYGKYNDGCRFVTPSGEYILFERDRVEEVAEELEIDLDGLELEWQLKNEELFGY